MVQYQWFEIKFNLLGGLINKNQNKGTYFVKKQNPVSLKIHQEKTLIMFLLATFMH